MGNGEWVMGNG